MVFMCFLRFIHNSQLKKKYNAHLKISLFPVHFDFFGGIRTFVHSSLGYGSVLNPKH